ncbi:MAG: hypothetical protein MHM6MM_003976 [Cercozoa sp. M6MM]
MADERIVNLVKEAADSLRYNGYAVLRNVIPRTEALAWRQKLVSWKDTVKRESGVSHLPGPKDIVKHGAGHLDSIWTARTDLRILTVFQALFSPQITQAIEGQEFEPNSVLDLCDVRELLTSFDGVCVSEGKAAWPTTIHCDQNPLSAPCKSGFRGYQAYLKLSDYDDNATTTRFMSGSHQHHADLFSRPKTSDRGFFVANADELNFLRTRGCRVQDVQADTGDMVIWDSRTFHAPHASKDVPRGTRLVMYINMRLRKDFLLPCLGDTEHLHTASLDSIAQALQAALSGSSLTEKETFEVKWALCKLAQRRFAFRERLQGNHGATLDLSLNGWTRRDEATRHRLRFPARFFPDESNDDENKTMRYSLGGFDEHACPQTGDAKEPNASELSALLEEEAQLLHAWQVATRPPRNYAPRSRKNRRNRRNQRR